MRRPTPSLPRVGRRLGRTLLTVVVVLAAASAALGMEMGSSPSDPAPTDAEPADAPAAPEHGEGQPHRGGAAYYRRTARKRVPADADAAFRPLYREAARSYGVSWRLIASIHRQETAFSTARGTYEGLNAFGCCAGPMQFNVTNGRVSTWELYRDAYREGDRPESYPHMEQSHPSVYDDFDAIMAAASLLSDSGAGRSLDGGAWQAAYSYYGHDLFGVTYANQVLARATEWERDGFCLNCDLDDGLVAEFEAAYGASVRQELIAAERRRKREEGPTGADDRNGGGRNDPNGRGSDDRRDADGRDADRQDRDRPRANRDSGSHERRDRSSGGGRADSAPRSESNDGRSKPPRSPSRQPSPERSTPEPSDRDCSGVRRLLGC